MYGKNKLYAFNGYHEPITIIAGISAAIGAGSAVAQSRQAKKSASAQREAQEAQGRAATVEAQQARIKQVREARIRRAQVTAAGEASGLGTSGTSGISGAVGSISSQMASNIGSINQQQTFAQETGAALQRSADAQTKGAQWQQIGQFSQSIFEAKGGWTSIFGGNTHEGK